MIIRCLCILILLTSVFSIETAAQDTRTVKGVVEAPDDAAVPGANVALTTAAADGPLSTTTDDEGEFAFKNVPAGDYILRVDSPGFKEARLPVAVGSAALRPVRVKLKISGVVEAVTVTSSSVKNVAVDQNPYSAEFGRPGKGRLEVTTKRGVQSRYRGNFLTVFRNSALDATNAFATVRPLQQRGIGEAELDGPISRTATFVVGGRYHTFNDSSVVFASTSSGPLIQNAVAPVRSTHLFGRIDDRLTPLHRISVLYTFKNRSLDNQGVGGLELPERGTNIFNHENEVKILETATPSARVLNQVRFAYKEELQSTTSVTNKPALLVTGFFNAGGAQISNRVVETMVDVEDVASILHGRHDFHFGGGIRPRFFSALDSSNFGGTFTFSSLGDYENGHPIQFSMNTGSPAVQFHQHEFYTFFQDGIHVRPSFSVTLGLRHEFQSNVPHYHNLAPRLAFAFAPGKGRETPAQATPSVVRIVPGIRFPYLMQGSLAIERKMGRGQNFLTLELMTVRGVELYRTRNVNAPLPGTTTPLDPNFISIDEFESSASSRSYSVAITYKGHFRKADIVTQYTLSRTLDSASSLFSLPASSYDLRGEWGRADYDRRHRLNIVLVYSFPAGFRMSGILNAWSGLPHNIITGNDDNGDTVINDRPPGLWRNAGRGPGYTDVDFRLARRWRLSRGDHPHSIEFAVDAFNALNHVNFKNYVGTMTSPFFGQANAAESARQLQLTARFIY